MKTKITIEEKEKIINMFISGLKIKEIADFFKRDQSAIGRLLRKNGFKTNNHVSEEISNNIAKLYNSGKSLNEISNILNLNSITIYNHCLKHNVNIRPVGSKLNINNKNFFDKLNKDSAYMLGLFVADGTMSIDKKSIGLSLKLEDKYLVKKFKELLGSEHKITICRGMAMIIMQDKDVFNSLINLGLPPKRKTYNLDGCEKLFSKLEKLKLIPHFTRGFLDGDGSIYVSKTKYFHKISFTSFSKPFLESINNFIMKEVGITTGYFYKRKKGNTWSLTFSGNRRVRSMLKWLYSDKNIFMIRKFKKAKLILNTLL